MIRIAFFFFLIAILACNRKSSATVPGDQEGLIISGKLYQKTLTNNYTISNALIKDDSLFITFGAGGCSSDSWKTSVVDAGMIAESHPVQRYLRLGLTNNERCAAFFSKKIAVNIRPLRVGGTNTVVLNLNEWEQQLVYRYE